MGCDHPSNPYLAVLGHPLTLLYKLLWSSLWTGPVAQVSQILELPESASSRVRGKSLDPGLEQRHCTDTVKAA